MPVRTAADRRRQAKVAYDAYLANCPSRQLLDRVADKWVCLVLSGLADGPKRHSQLARLIAGVSQKMLTQTLRALVRDGLVLRTVTPSVPVRVDYALTALGRGLQVEVSHLKRWAEQHMREIIEARHRYDTSGPALLKTAAAS